MEFRNVHSTEKSNSIKLTKNNMYAIKTFYYTLLTLLILSSTSCGVYNFTGGSIATNVKTINISVFPNESSSGPPSMSQSLTEKIKDYYQSNSKLTVVTDNGDWQLSGYISGYVVTPVAPKANETTALSRLTITVKAEFVNTKDETQNFSQAFSFYGDFDQTKSLSAVEKSLVDEILNQIVFDIFTKTTSNW